MQYEVTPTSYLSSRASAIVTAALSRWCRLAQQRYHTAPGGWRGARLRPRIHDFPALLKQVAASVSRLDLVADNVRQCHLGDLGRKRGALGRPITKARPKSVRRQIAAAHAAQQHQHRHVADWPAGPVAGEDEIALARVA